MDRIVPGQVSEAAEIPAVRSGYVAPLDAVARALTWTGLVPRFDEVLLLLARPAELLAGDLRPTVLGLLSPIDLAHAARFRAERDRDIALASRATQRLALSSVTGQEVPPTAWQFVTGQNGRPLLHDPPPPWSALRFSAANAFGLVGCAVCAHREVGLDLEMHRQELSADLLGRCLSVRERSELYALVEQDRPHRFTRLWTAKEAYLKARGLGIAELLDQVQIDFGADDQPALRLGAALHDIGRHWQLQYLQPTAEHFAALCIERVEGVAMPRISQRWAQLPADQASAGRPG
jgi:4'-phosphopantetheinyl transferase